MRAACSAIGWIRCAEARRIRLALVAPAFFALTAALGVAQTLPRLHITALGLHADHSVVTPGELFHVTVHVHVRERRDRLDELVLPSLTNAIDLGDERRRVPAPDGTDFYETLTVTAETVGYASFSPAYIDAVDPATGRGMRYSSQALSVRVANGAGVAQADGGALGTLLRNAALTAVAVIVLLALAVAVAVRRRPSRAADVPAPPEPPRPVPQTGDPLRDALSAFRVRGDDASLDRLRGELFVRAGASRGATFADALRVLGNRDPELARALAVAERARFGPEHERKPAARDLLALLDAYLPDSRERAPA